MRPFITAFVALAAFSEWHSPATLLGQQRPPVIDMHLHADLPPYDVPQGAPALCRPEPCQGTGPQLHGDVSTASWVIPRATFYDYLEAFVRAGLGKRLMFGSDQMRWPEKIGEGIAAIEQAPFLTAEQKRDILYHNAVRFLRLEQDIR
jgi:hypothetical protein